MKHSLKSIAIVAITAVIALLAGTVAHAQCQWNYSFVNNVATATYCGNAIVNGNFTPGSSGGFSGPITFTRTPPPTIDLITVQGNNILGDSMFSHAFEDTTVFTSTTTGGYASYDTLATMGGTNAMNHFYGYEDRRNYTGTGLLNGYTSFVSLGMRIQGPVNAVRAFAVTSPVVSGGGSAVEWDGLWLPDITIGTSINYGVRSQLSAQTGGAGKYNLYIDGTSPNLFNGQMQMKGGQIWGARTVNNPSTIFVQDTVGQFFNFATDTNLVIGGSGTNSYISSLNDAGNTYKAMLLNASVIDVAQAGFGLGTASNLKLGELGFQRISESGPVAPGALAAKIAVVCGTNSGTAKLIMFAGTSNTPVTVLDNVGSGVSGC